MIRLSNLTAQNESQKNTESDQISIVSWWIESLSCQINPKKCSNTDLNPNRNWDLPITGKSQVRHNSDSWLFTDQYTSQSNKYLHTSGVSRAGTMTLWGRMWWRLSQYCMYINRSYSLTKQLPHCRVNWCWLWCISRLSLTTTTSTRRCLYRQ